MGFFDFIRGKARQDEQGGSWETILGTVADKGDAIFNQLSIAQKEKVYGQHAVVRSCIDIYCAAFKTATLEIGAYDPSGKEFTVDESPEAQEWITLLEDGTLDPSYTHDYSETDFWDYNIARKLLTGISYVWKWRANNGKVVELWPTPTSRILIHQGESESSRLYSSFEYIASSYQDRVLIDPKDMLYFRHIDPSNMTGYSSPLDSATRWMQNDNEQVEYVHKLLKNYSLPGLKINSTVALTPTQRSNIKADLRDSCGDNKQGSSLVLPQGITAEVMQPITDLDWPNLSAMNETRICGAYQVPPIMAYTRAGLERATFSNAAEMRKLFYTTAMVPFWQSIAEDLTNGLLRAEGDMARQFKFNTSEVPELQEDKDSRIKRGISLWESGLGNKNESRQIVGLEPLDVQYGEVFRTRMGYGEATVAELGMPTNTVNVDGIVDAD